MSDMTTRITNPAAAARSGEVEIVEVALFPQSGSTDYIDIKFQVVEINFYGDLYSPFYSAKLNVLDNNGLLHHLPIRGGEIVVITVRSGPEQSSITISKIFTIYTVKNYVVDGEYNTLYNIELISYMGHVNNLIRIDGKFSGNCTDIVTNVVDQYLKEPCEAIAEHIDTSTERTAVTTTHDMFDFFLNKYIHQPSLNNIDFVACGWSPAYTLNWVSEKALAESRGNSPENASFIFNEGLRYITYDTLDNLFFVGRLRADPHHNVNGLYQMTYLPVGQSRNPEVRAMIIVDFKFIGFGDMLKTHSVGSLASSLETFDIVTKRYHKQTSDWVSKAKDYAQLEDFDDVGHGHFPSSGKDKGLYAFDSPRSFDSKKFSIVKHNQLFDGLPSYMPERIQQLRNFQFAALENIIMEITVYGRFDIEAGHVVWLSFPVDKANEDKGREAEVITGYFFVTAVRHKITQDLHVTILEVVKESMSVEGINE